MTDKLFYIIFVVAIFVSVAIGLQFNLNFKYWIASIAALVFYLWNKDVITGKPDIKKNQLKPKQENSPIYNLNDEEYENFVNTHY